MATNPMQKKARNAFLLGVLIMLIISAIAGAFAYFLLFANNDKDKEGIQKRQVYTVTSSIKSGDKIQNGVNIKLSEIETGIASTDAVNGATLGDNATAKINLTVGTILTSSMVNIGEAVTNDVRLVEYNMITLPTSVTVGTYIDVRLTLPSGQDYIVVSKKPIISLQGTTIGLNLSEGEILIMNSAIVEAYIMTASNLYATQYVEPGLQEAAVNTYRPTDAVVALIQADSNIIATAREKLTSFYNSSNAQILRQNFVNPALEQYSATALENIEAGIVKQKADAAKARTDYLTGITQ